MQSPHDKCCVLAQIAYKDIAFEAAIRKVRAYCHSSNAIGLQREFGQRRHLVRIRKRVLEAAELGQHLRVVTVPPRFIAHRDGQVLLRQHGLVTIVRNCAESQTFGMFRESTVPGGPWEHNNRATRALCRHGRFCRGRLDRMPARAVRARHPGQCTVTTGVVGQAPGRISFQRGSPSRERIGTLVTAQT